MACRMCGATDEEALPGTLDSTGTSRQPTKRCPSSATTRSTSCSSAWRLVASRGRKNEPTPYAPAAGSSAPSSARKSASGTCTRMPAPSPVWASAPEAPRCSRLASAVSARSTVSCDGAASRRATNATPHASCSYAGSYRPVECRCAVTRGVLASRVEGASPPLVLVGGGGGEGRLAQTDARDEREDDRLAGVRCARHRDPEDHRLGVSRQPCYPVSPLRATSGSCAGSAAKTPAGRCARCPCDSVP